MKRKRYSEEKIISILMEHKVGAAVPDITRLHGIAENTIYHWKSKYGGMNVLEAKRLRIGVEPWNISNIVDTANAGAATWRALATPHPGAH